MGEMTVIAILLVDWLHELKCVCHARGRQVKDQFYRFLQYSIRIYTGSIGVRLDIQENTVHQFR